MNASVPTCGMCMISHRMLKRCIEVIIMRSVFSIKHLQQNYLAV
jgi:hypothetical protein